MKTKLRCLIVLPLICLMAITLGAPAVAATDDTVPVEEAIDSVRPYVDIIWTYDWASQQWQVYEPQVPDIGNLSIFRTGQSYWLRVTQDCLLTYESQSHVLDAGWNPIVCLSPSGSVPSVTY